MTVQSYAVDVQLRSPAGELLDHLPVDAKNAGAITDDRTSAIRRTISRTIRVVDPTGRLIPQFSSDVLHPYSGNELWIYRGGQPLGVFGLSKPDVHVGSDGWYLELSGSDRSHRIQRAAWTDIYSIAAGSNLDSAVVALIENRMAAAGVSGWAFSLAPSSVSLPDTTFGLTGSSSGATDPWADAQGLFTDFGMELFFDAQGVLTGQVVANPASAPSAATFTDGVGGTLVEIERGVDIDESYSGVLVIGTGAGVTTPVNAVAWDPSSVAHMGQVPYVYMSSTIQDSATAMAAAEALLPVVVGAQETVTIQAVPDPARHSSEVIHVVSKRAGIDAQVLIQQVQHPLGADQPMTISATRQVPA